MTRMVRTTVGQADPSGRARSADPTRMDRRSVLLSLLACAVAGPAFAADGEALRFTHAFGETVLPRPATRVVSLGFTAHDTLLALETPPVAVRYWFGDQPHAVWPWAQPYLKGTEPQVIAGEASVETVAALQPDLIVAIGSGISEAEYALFSQIAPTLVHEARYPGYGTPWDELARTLGRAVGKADLAEILIANTEARFAEARARHPDWKGRTGVAAYHFGGDVGAFTSIDTRARFLAELGFNEPPGIASLSDPSNFFVGLSPEDLSPLDADLLVWVSSTDAAPYLVNLPMRRMLRAHGEGREVFAGALVAAAMSFGSILSLPFALEALEGDIVAAMDGDPKTPVPTAVQAGLAP